METVNATSDKTKSCAQTMWILVSTNIDLDDCLGPKLKRTETTFWKDNPSAFDDVMVKTLRDIKNWQWGKWTFDSSFKIAID